MARRINAPGIEVNEIDRSRYNQTVDNSTVGTASLVLGFADKGDDYNVKWINTMTTFLQTYGSPETEAEKYFYNTVYEIIDRGGVCYTSKLPYYNNSLNNYVYTSYTVDTNPKMISSVNEVTQKINVQVDSNSKPLDKVLFNPDFISNDDTTIKEFNSISNFRQYIITKANLDITQQNDIISIFKNKSSNKFSNGLEDIMGVGTNQMHISDSYWLSGDGENDPTIPLEQISSIAQTIIQVFQTDKVNEMIKQYVDELYLNDINDYFNDISAKYSGITITDQSKLLNSKYTEIRTADDSIKKYITINSEISGKNELMSFKNYDKFLIKEMKVPKNKIYVVDITRGKYNKDIFGNEIVGVMPVIVTPVNALFYQEVIRNNNNILSSYNVISKIRNSYRTNSDGVFEESVKPFDQSVLSVETYNDKQKQFIGLGEYLGSEADVTINDYTVSQSAAEQFPVIKYIDGRLDREYLKQIGIVVYKIFKDSANENKISLVPVESFIGSLSPTSRSGITNTRNFIDDIVNENSEYINVFSNVEAIDDLKYNDKPEETAQTYIINNQVGCSMGFYKQDTIKDIHVTESIYKPIQKVFDKYTDRNILDFDILIDGGISNIAQFIASTCLYDRYGVFVKDTFNRYGKYDLGSDSAYLFNQLSDKSHVAVWRKVIQRYDEFVKNFRRDCIFLADGPRPFCLECNSKILRHSKPNNTVKNSILPKLKYVSNVINSSYSAGYINWFWSLDHYSGEYIWMPPTIKALGVYLYTDNMGAFWDAPAGLNRGGVTDTLDVAFNPTNEEAGQIYINSWNYAISYPLDGIVIEGQKTFQRDQTALDRVNVRRLMLGMEKTIRNICKYFNYEGNTAFLRARLKDAIDRYLEQVKANDGISEFITVCDETNNTQTSIDNNELHLAIAIRPIKSIEFIVLGFLCTNQSVDVEEALQSELNNM